MDALFGQRKRPADIMKQYQRQIKKSIRELDRERTSLERQEKKLMSDIKKAAKDGHMDSAKIMAKDLVRTRGYIKKMYKMSSNMSAISLRLQTMSSSAQMAKCMGGVTKAMRRMNGKMNMPQMSKIMMEFEKQNEMMGMKEEMMGDAMDDAFDDEDDEDEQDAVLGSVLAERGVETMSKMDATPQGQMAAADAGAGQAEQPQAAAAAGGGGGGDDDGMADLQARLDNLRRT